MPIEIREISIHTKITSTSAPPSALSEQALHQLKKQWMQECLKMLKTANANNKSSFDR